jgi:indolin-2-one monooxygenase/3-hydroxyindolin-2-one monooxygenase/benzoxazinone N-monooxygenase
MVLEEYLSCISYLKATIKEAMRLHPLALFLLPHFSTNDCEINGYTILSDTRIIVNAWVLSRDPSCWERVDEFFLEWFLQEGRDAEVDMYSRDIWFVPFGASRRICVGVTFVVATVEGMVANLIYSFHWELPREMEAADTKIDMSDQFWMTLRRKENLLLVHKPT